MDPPTFVYLRTNEPGYNALLLGEVVFHGLKKEDLNLICTDEAPRHVSVQGTLNIPKSC